MLKVLFDLKNEDYFNSLFPLYKQLKNDDSYDIYFNVGKDHRRFGEIFLISQKQEIEAKLQGMGLQITEQTSGFNLVIYGDALNHPEKYQNAALFHLDQGIGLKTLRMRNINYHVFGKVNTGIII
ncbi:MAG: hypothetical protein PWQ09_1218 [Candidatus Cloacimonadota bacterium]|jgi:hypothetical protein|nr:hypothetical protein [Candidatus Cloacimonadota bacterium]